MVGGDVYWFERWDMAKVGRERARGQGARAAAGIFRRTIIIVEAQHSISNSILYIHLRMRMRMYEPYLHIGAASRQDDL